MSLDEILAKTERERLARLTEIRSDPHALSTTHRPGEVQIRNNPNSDSDCDYFTCPGCGRELYSSMIHAWSGIDCASCGCSFSAIDEGGGTWDFDKLPKLESEQEA